MHELMPVLFGAMLGFQRRRGALSRSLFVIFVMLAAVAASIASGEFAHSPFWILSDLALVSFGALTPALPAIMRSAVRASRQYARRTMRRRHAQRTYTQRTYTQRTYTQRVHAQHTFARRWRRHRVTHLVVSVRDAFRLLSSA